MVRMVRKRQALDRALDRLVAGEAPGEGLGDLAPLLDAASRARRSLSVRVPPGLAERHLAARRPASAPSPGSEAPRLIGLPRRRLRVAAVAVAATLLLAMGGTQVAWAADGSLPGDALYPVKRAVERLNLLVHADPASKSRLHLEFAERRLAELQALIAARGNPARIAAAARDERSEIAAAAADLDSARARGSDVGSLAALVESEIGRHVERLEYVRDNLVPDAAKDAIQRAIDNATTARDRVRERGTHGKPAEPGPAETPGPGKGGTTPPRGRGAGQGQGRG